MKALLKKILMLYIVFVALTSICVFADTQIESEYLPIQTNTKLPDNSNLFVGYTQKVFYPDNNISLFGTSAKEQLGDNDQFIYNVLKSHIELIACGDINSTTISISSAELQNNRIKTTWTKSELGVTKIDSTVMNTVFSEFKSQFNFTKVVDALLHDCPYDFYWYDKTFGTSVAPSSLYSSGSATIVKLTFRFSVSPYYKSENYNLNTPTTDTSKTKAAVNAANNAKSIVEKYTSISDYEKLNAYRDEICKLVSYNDDAASDSYTDGYGDPWQLIYVFDNNPSTNVVCEGYSKAFQYLCDLSDLDNAVCYTVIGTMGSMSSSGGHMWNVVSMSDGKNYLVDITNSDDGAVGYNGGLFLAGASGTLTEQYLIYCGYSSIYYKYDINTLNLWGTDSNSILNIADKDYTINTIQPIGFYADKITIEKITDDSTLKLIISPKISYSLPQMSLYTTIYNSDKSIKSIKVIPCKTVNGKVNLTLSAPSVSNGETYKIMLFTNFLSPLVKTIELP